MGKMRGSRMKERKRRDLLVLGEATKGDKSMLMGGGK